MFRSIVKPFLILFCLLLTVTAWAQDSSQTLVKLETTHGTLLLKLHDQTPKHRDNFLKIVKDGVLDSLLFHRVIQNFMIQGGDTQSRYAKAGDTLGSNDLPYTIPAEMHPDLFHRKGALAAARGDTPERESSSTQFYIVQGKVYNDSLLDRAENRINEWLAQYYIKHDPLYSEQLAALNKALDEEDWETAGRINAQFREQARSYRDFLPYRIPEEQRLLYKTEGGTPFLDQNYTVFGQLLSGFEVVDAIGSVPTDGMDRPLEDVRILRATIIEE